MVESLNTTRVKLADFRDMSELPQYQNIDNPPIFDEETNEVIFDGSYSNQLSQNGSEDISNQAEQARQDRAAREALLSELSELELEDLALFVKAKREFIENSENGDVRWLLVKITSV